MRPDVNAGPESRAQTATSIRFAIELAPGTAGPVHVLLDRSDAQPGWVEVTRDGIRVYLRERCDIEDCGVRAAVCGMAIPVVRDLAATEGRLVELVWDVATSVLDTPAGCERREAASPGVYIARFCYSPRAEYGGPPTLPGIPGDRLVDPMCVERSFTPEDREVVLRL
jgi:hypothetical protein